MAKACERGRCPARADVDDWNETEYRKKCRATPCRTAHNLAAQRTKANKAAAGAVVVSLADRSGLAAALAATKSAAAQKAANPDVGLTDDVASFDIVGAVRADLEAITPTHPMHRSLSAIALAMAHQLQMAGAAPTASARGAARQLADTLRELAPAKGDDDELTAFLADLAKDDDDDDVAQPTG